MQPFTTLTGMVVPMDRVNVDTDQMVPKQFLKLLTREGFGRVLFYDWRYLPGEKPNPDFVMNHPRYKGASVLLARANSAAAPAASTRLGRSSTTVSARFSLPATPTFFTTTASRTASCPSRSQTNRLTSCSSAPL